MKMKYGREEEMFLKEQRAEDLKLLYEYDDTLAEIAWRTSERDHISIDQAFEAIDKAIKKERRKDKQE